MYDTLITQLAEKQGITEQLKADDMMAWVQKMINNRSRSIRGGGDENPRLF